MNALARMYDVVYRRACHRGLSSANSGGMTATLQIMKPDLVTLLNALADRTRLRLLNLLGCGEVCVCYFVELLDEAQPKISRHLAYSGARESSPRGAMASGCTTRS